MTPYRETSLKDDEMTNGNLQIPQRTGTGVRSFSIGSGSFPVGGDVHFVLRKPCKKLTVTGNALSPILNNTHTCSSSKEKESRILKKRNEPPLTLTPAPSKSKSVTRSRTIIEKVSAVKWRHPVSFIRRQSSFMRISDLDMLKTSVHNDHDEIHEHFHHASVTPPHGVNTDSKERWVALDDGVGSHSPIAPFAIQALVASGVKSAMAQSMWTPADKKTQGLLRNGGTGTNSKELWGDLAWQEKGCACVPPRESLDEAEILLWTGCFKHSYYGSHLPCLRILGVVNMGAKKLFDLLMDSNRVKEYNKFSVGRTDLLLLQDNLLEDGHFGRSITKVVQSETKPPIFRKVVRFVTLMHGKELDDGNGYLIVSRAVTKGGDDTKSQILPCEILLGVNIIRRVQGDENRCLMTNVNHNHTGSSAVPVMITKKLGLAAASSFITDIRSIC